MNVTIKNTLIANQTTTEDNVLSNITLEEWLLIAAFILIILIGGFGNILVIYVFGCGRKTKVRSSTEWLILYLGIIDLLSSLFNPSLYIYWTVTDFKWHFGFVGCKVLPAIGPITTTTSSAFLLIFAVDRYLAIVSPFRGHLSWKSITIACVAAIIVSILSYLHYIYFLELSADNKCGVANAGNKEYGIPNCTLVILRLFIFAFVFTYTNYMIFTKLNSNEKLPKDLREKRVRQSRGIMRILLSMGVVFVFLVYPRELFYLMFNMSWLIRKEGIIDFQIALQINAWLKVMHTSNSCANIFIYAHMQSRFRRSILTVLFKVGLCKRNYLKTTLYSFSQATPFSKSRFSARFSFQKTRSRIISFSRTSIQSSPLLKSKMESKRTSIQSSPLLKSKNGK